MASMHFRAGVVIVIRHPETHEVLAFERADAPDTWQLPQGGLKDGETPIEGAWREMLEETDLGDVEVELISEHPEWLVYEWPVEMQRDKSGTHQRISQAQRRSTFHARSGDILPTPDGSEFVAWKWVSTEWLIDHVPAWRRAPYQIVLGQHPVPAG